MTIFKTLRTLSLSAALVAAPFTLAIAGDNTGSKAGPSAPAQKGEAKFAPAVTPKPLSSQVNKGLAWLLEHQLPNGAWGQGEEAAGMGRGMEEMKDKGNVADTCMAALAVIRAGSTPSSGPHANAVKKALGFVLSEIEKSDADGLAVTDIRGTRVQGKIGPYVDTFMSANLLAETKGKIEDPALARRHASALAKVLRKIEKNQRQDGSFEGQAWAPVLSQAMAAKGLNKAAQVGEQVSGEALKRTEGYAQGQFDSGKKAFSGEGGAGVNLYSAAASSGALSDSANTRAIEEQVLREEVKNAKTDKERRQAEARLKDHDDARTVRNNVQGALVEKLADPSFVSGFGNNGGEEFLSYMLVSESLVTKGGKEWADWDKSMTANLNRVQNPDGSWTGHHCITGRTFVTASALLVLTADRAPVPLAAQLKKG